MISRTLLEIQDHKQNTQEMYPIWKETLQRRFFNGKVLSPLLLIPMVFVHRPRKNKVLQFWVQRRMDLLIDGWIHRLNRILLRLKLILKLSE